MIEDLLLNLVAEVVGIAVTIVIIDRLLEKREKKRWLPTKHQIYAKLFNVLEDFFTAIQVGPVNEQEFVGKAYQYGKTTVTGYGSFKGLELGKILERIENRYNLHAKLEWDFDPSLLSPLKTQVTTILDTSTSILEPEELELLFQLDNSIATLGKFVPRLTKLDTESKVEDLAYMLSDVISKAVAVRVHLEQKAHRTVTIKEYLDELVSQAQGKS